MLQEQQPKVLRGSATVSLCVLLQKGNPKQGKNGPPPSSWCPEWNGGSTGKKEWAFLPTPKRTTDRGTSRSVMASLDSLVKRTLVSTEFWIWDETQIQAGSCHYKDSQGLCHTHPGTRVSCLWFDAMFISCFLPSGHGIVKPLKASSLNSSGSWGGHRRAGKASWGAARSTCDKDSSGLVSGTAQGVPTFIPQRQTHNRTLSSSKNTQEN